MKRSEIWAEMARRKVQFHPDEDWSAIRQWGLFDWGDVSKLIREGLLITSMEPENRTVWVWPSAEAWQRYIEPLVANHSLDELSVLAGWPARVQA